MGIFGLPAVRVGAQTERDELRQRIARLEAIVGMLLMQGPEETRAKFSAWIEFEAAIRDAGGGDAKHGD